MKSDQAEDASDNVEKMKLMLHELFDSSMDSGSLPPPILDRESSPFSEAEDVLLPESRRTVVDFVNKYLQTIVRAREVLSAGSKALNIAKCSSLLVQDDGFWQNALPLHLDVCSVGSCEVLLERWVIAFQPDHANLYRSSLSREQAMEYSTASLSDVSTSALSARSTPIASPPPKDAGSLKRSNHDTTNLILMAQSLYSHIRLLPLHCLIQSARLESTDSPAKDTPDFCFKTYLATPDGLLAFYDSSGMLETCSGQRSFDPTAKLKFYKFPPAPYAHGHVHLSVVYDTDAGKSAASRCRCAWHSSARSKGDVKSNNASTLISTSKVDRPSTPKRQPSASSPFPSPSIQRKVLSIAQLKHSKCGKNHMNVNASARVLSGMRRGSSADDYDKRSVSPLKLLFTSLIPTGNNFSGVTIPARTLVGSYEDSLWHARMSKLPSKPIEFFAELGVVGLGKCPARLRCPPHVVLPFPAWYYELEEDKAPTTPYAGFLHVPKSRRAELRLKSAGYRVPPKGQLQVIVKNQSNVAVKVFLVPYNLCDMPLCSRYHLRQKSYAMPPESSSKDRGHLRYAIHLQFVCLATSQKYYLSPKIRFIFCQRTLDLGEKLMVVSEALPQGPGSLSVSNSTGNLVSCEIGSLNQLSANPAETPFSSLPIQSNN